MSSPQRAQFTRNEDVEQLEKPPAGVVRILSNANADPSKIVINRAKSGLDDLLTFERQLWACKRITSDELKATVTKNYSTFIDASHDIKDISTEMVRLNHLFNLQASNISQLKSTLQSTHQLRRDTTAVDDDVVVGVASGSRPDEVESELFVNQSAGGLVGDGAGTVGLDSAAVDGRNLAHLLEQVQGAGSVASVKGRRLLLHGNLVEYDDETYQYKQTLMAFLMTDCLLLATLLPDAKSNDIVRYKMEASPYEVDSIDLSELNELTQTVRFGFVMYMFPNSRLFQAPSLEMKNKWLRTFEETKRSRSALVNFKRESGLFIERHLNPLIEEPARRNFALPPIQSDDVGNPFTDDVSETSDTGNRSRTATGATSLGSDNPFAEDARRESSKPVVRPAKKAAERPAQKNPFLSDSDEEEADDEVDATPGGNPFDEDETASETSSRRPGRFNTGSSERPPFDSKNPFASDSDSVSKEPLRSRGNSRHKDTSKTSSFGLAKVDQATIRKMALRTRKKLVMSFDPVLGGALDGDQVDGGAVERTAAMSEQLAKLLEDERMYEAPEQLDVAIAQRDFEAAVELVEEVKRNFEPFVNFPAAQPYLMRIDDRIKKLTDSLSNELIMPAERALRGGPLAFRKAVLLLVRLGKSSVACDLFLKNRSSIIQYNVEHLRLENHVHTYISNLCSVEFFWLHNAAEQFDRAFGDHQHCYSTFVTWMQQELRLFVSNFTEKVSSDNATLSTLANCVSTARQHCSQLRGVGLDMTFYLDQQLYHEVQRSVAKHRSQLIDGIRQDAHRLVKSLDAWKPFTLFRKSEKQKLSQEMFKLGMLDFEKNWLRCSEAGWTVNASEPTVRFGKLFLRFVADSIELHTAELDFLLRQSIPAVLQEKQNVLKKALQQTHLGHPFVEQSINYMLEIVKVAQCQWESRLQAKFSELNQADKQLTKMTQTLCKAEMV